MDSTGCLYQTHPQAQEESTHGMQTTHVHVHVHVLIIYVHVSFMGIIMIIKCVRGTGTVIGTG